MPDKPGGCLICGSADEPTDEHIVPKTLLQERFGLDPDHERLARYRTDLCDYHNGATGKLHARTDVMELIAKGEPLTSKSVCHLADWAIWVTLLLGLAAGGGVVPDHVARRFLMGRFGEGKGKDRRPGGGPPPGVRVYAARVTEYVKGTDFVSHMVGVKHDRNIRLSHSGDPVGFTVGEGPITASESIGLGKFAILVLSPTYPSGAGHNKRLDAAAATVGLDRIHPTPRPLPAMTPREVDITAVSKVFIPPPWGSDASLLPDAVRGAVSLIVRQDR